MKPASYINSRSVSWNGSNINNGCARYATVYSRAPASEETVVNKERSDGMPFSLKTTITLQPENVSWFDLAQLLTATQIVE